MFGITLNVNPGPDISGDLRKPQKPYVISGLAKTFTTRAQRRNMIDKRCGIGIKCSVRRAEIIHARH